MKDVETAQAGLTGTATFRERIALPPNAVFEATLEDVSRADAVADVLGRSRIESPGNPPFKFELAYDPARIDQRHRYAVRARITVDGQLMFTTDTHYGVLTQGQGNTVDIMMRRGGSSPAPAAITPSGATAQRLQGEYMYMADAGLFLDCATGQRLPVAQEADNAALESAYLEARPEPGAPLLAIVEGRIEGRMPMEGPGPRPTLIVDRFVSIGPGSCAGAPSTASLENSYWKLMRLGTNPVSVAEGGREPHFILQLDESEWLNGETLILFDAGGAPVAEFESRYMK